MGRPKRSASSISRRAFRYPSGRGIPKLRTMFSLVFRPFWCPSTITGRSSSLAQPPTMEGSSPYSRSPASSKKSVKSNSR